MQPPHTSLRQRVGPYPSVIELGKVDPTTVLASFEGEPRGFWGGGDEWVAWGGALARIEVPSGAPSRFPRVREAATRILSELRWERSGTPPFPWPRFFGGFSFLADGSTDSVWKGFPGATFILPRVLVACRDGRARAISSGGDAEAQALVRAGRSESSMEEVPKGGPGSASRASVREPDSEARERWRNAIDGILTSIERGDVRKAVLARYLDLATPESVDPLVALRTLRRENRRAHVFLMEGQPGQVFLGAAPELLARLRGGRFEATAVAGSMPRAGDRDSDAGRARKLLESAKDREEHALTAEEMVEVLGPHLTEMDVETEPRVLSLARIHHLETTIRGRTRIGEDILTLVEALHPTPAVCGRPRAEALALIRAAEPFDRGWYSGPVGWFDADGDGDFVPALRAAVGSGREWRLFAGAGIVSGSDPDAEWEETALKFQPALRALLAGAGNAPEGD